MKAVRIHAHGGVEQLRYERIDDPRLASDDDAIVKLHAACTNTRDIRVRNGSTAQPVSLPLILGGDGAGSVIELGARAKNIRIGDAVVLYPAVGCGRCEKCAADREFMCPDIRMLGEREPGTYADFVCVPARNCFPIPAGFSFQEAAALPFVYTTVWRMLITNAQLKPGEWILVRGGSELVTAVVRLAATLGARVLVAGRGDFWLATVKELGAQHTVDEDRSDVVKDVREFTAKRGVDVVVDCVAGEGWIQSLACLAKGGRLVTCDAVAGANPQTDVQRIFWNDLSIFGSTLGDRREFLEVMNFMAASGARPVIDQAFALKDAARAQQRLERGNPIGQMVLCMDG